jgi:dTDP-4-dehydrorhamnose reductase
MGNVLLFGGQGLLGTAIQKNWQPEWGNLAVAPRLFDITDAEAMVTVFGDNKPSIVINCAAVDDVDESQKNPLKALEVNARGPEVLATCAEAVGSILIHISTDYVFGNAASNRPFTEKDPPQPLNEYGGSKWEGEKRVIMYPKHYVLRVSSLYGTARRTHAGWIQEALDTGKPVKIAADMVGSPTYTGHLATWIGDLIAKKPPYGIYHLCHSGFCSRFEFAEKLCELRNAKKPYPLEKITLASLKLPAPRPLRPLLSTEKWQKAMAPLPSWQDGLKAYLAEVDSK